MNTPLTAVPLSSFPSRRLALMLAGGTVLLALVALPFALGVGINFFKLSILLIGGLLAVAVAVVGWLQQREVSVPFAWPFLGFLAVPLAYVLATFFSPAPTASLWGEGATADALVPVTVAAALGALVAFLFRRRSQFAAFFFGLAAAYLLSWAYTIAVVWILPIAARFFSFSVVVPAPTLVGGWEAFAMWSGLMVVLSLVAGVTYTWHGRMRLLLSAIIVLGLLALAVVNFSYLWALVGLVALPCFVYSLTTSRFIRAGTISSEVGERGAVTNGAGVSSSEVPAWSTSFSVAPLLVLAVALVFWGSGSALSGWLAPWFGAQALDVRPSWQVTAQLLKTSYDEHLWFGAGPSLFWRVWNAHRPEEVNLLPFWNVDFPYAAGVIPTALITTGLVGALAWLFFFAGLAVTGVRALVVRPSPDPLWFAISLTSFTGAWYLWLLLIVATPPYPFLVLAFVFTGLFYASVVNQVGGFSERIFSFLTSPRLGFLVVLVLTIIFLASVVGLFRVGQWVAGHWYLARSAQAQSLEDAMLRLERAAQLIQTDEVARAAVALYLRQLQALLQQEDLSQEELQTSFQQLVQRLIATAQRATELDPGDYRNWVALAQAYEALVPLKVEGAYDRAKESYEHVLQLKPHAPEVYLALARLELARGARDAAREYISKALEAKRDFIPAIFLLAQVQLQEGKTDEAIASVRTATLLEPQNPALYFQLGLLYYGQKNYRAARDAFMRAVTLAGGRYANALFFLALSEYELGNQERAQAYLERLATLDPASEVVKRVLENLKKGKRPFAGMGEGAGSTALEQLREPPVKEPASPAQSGE